MSNLYPKVRIILGFAKGCHWCDRFKQKTLPMIKALKLHTQEITNEQHLKAYNADHYGFPLIVFCNEKGYPLVSHGGYLTLPEFMQKLEAVYEKFFPGEDPNAN